MAELTTPYRVLARKYRPQNFDELIGQDALVRTLRNAITSGRIAHAFMLTGVRGVGKTTTARIIAKALNYTGADGTAGPTIGDTSDCALCRAISEDRHPDVIEMDAASRTGVDDIREILDGVRYAPTEARYKIYVIDEVHMLSKNAFNALLKTLEEPPPHVKFIFATTEIRKVPITVLSRCQRFDLQRVGVDTLVPHFKNILEKENVKAEDDAITMIARAADGSVRDGLSLLDQAIALSGEKIEAAQVRDMLGLADRTRTLDLLEHALTGKIGDALDVMHLLYQNGADPSVVIQDLLDLTHMLTRLRAVPDAGNLTQALTSDQLDRLRNLSAKLSMPTLGKTWQILLKGLPEINEAPNPQAAAEMVIIRLVYAGDLPDPSDLLKRLKDAESNGGTHVQQGVQGHVSHGAPVMAQGQIHHQDFTPPPHAQTHMTGSGQEIMRAAPSLSLVPQATPTPTLSKLEDMVQLLRGAEEFLLAEQIIQFAHLVKLEHINHGDTPHGRLEMRLADGALPKFASDLGQALKTITDQRWMVSVVNAAGQPTLAQQAEARHLQELADVSKIPLVESILHTFPEAKLVRITLKTDQNPQE